MSRPKSKSMIEGSPTSPGGGGADDASDSTSNKNDGGNVVVICRVRPFNRREIDIQNDMNSAVTHEWERLPLRSVIEMEGSDTVFLDHLNHYAERQRFPFDFSFWSVPAEQQQSSNPFAEQVDIYNNVGVPIIKNVWNGFHNCIFAYGQTGSGKTYSMMGSDSDPGLIPRVCKGLFETIEKRREEEAASKHEDGIYKEYRLEARFFEIYNEKVKDLLWNLRTASDEDANIDRENIRVRHMGSEITLVGLTTMVVQSAQDCLDLIEEGTRNRSVGATKMNDTSSRSHSIFRLTFVQTTRVLPKDKFEKPKVYNRTSMVSLVDLAGSERMKKTGAEGQRLKEAVAINQSLTTLKNVIDALVEQRSVIPYRDSTLTWILSDNLGGNSKTFMIACVSPHLDNAEESLNSLRYALRAQSIVCHATVNESDELKRMNRMKEELERLKAEAADGAGDNEYLSLKSKQEELNRSAASTKDQAEAAVKNEATRRKELEALKKQKYNVCYRAAFHRVFQKKADLAYTGFFARDEATLAGYMREVDSYRHDAGSTDKELSENRAEERRTLSALRNSEAELARLKDRMEKAQTSLRDLDKMEARNMEAIAHKQARVPISTHVSKQFIQRKLIMISIERERVMRQHTAALDKLKEEYHNELEQIRQERAQRIEPLQARQKEEHELMEEEEVVHKQNMKELLEKMTALQSSCVFVENENKRSATEVDEQILNENKVRFESFAASESAGKKRVQDFQMQSKTSLASQLEAMRLELSDQQAMHESTTDRVIERARDDVLRIRRDGETKAAATAQECKSRLHRFQNLNNDAGLCWRSSKAAQKRYSEVYESIMAVLNGVAPPDIASADQMDAVEDLIDKLQQALGLSSSRAKTPRSTNVQHQSQTPLAFRTQASPERSPPGGGGGGAGGRSLLSRSSSMSRTPSHTSSSKVGGYQPRPGVVSSPSYATPPSTGNNSGGFVSARGRSSTPQQLRSMSAADAAAAAPLSPASHHSSTTKSPSVLRRERPEVYQTATTKLRQSYAEYAKFERSHEKQQIDKELLQRQKEMLLAKPQLTSRSAIRARAKAKTPTKTGGVGGGSSSAASNKDSPSSPSGTEPWNHVENFWGYQSLSTNEEAIPCSQRVVIEGSVIAMRTHSLVGSKGKRGGSRSPPMVTPRATPRKR